MIITNQMRREATAVIVWASVAWALVEILARVTPIAYHTLLAFFGGAGVMFLALTVLGHYRLKRVEQERKAAMDQFIKDQKADQEKQAKIDREIIDQLRNEHQLSGSEQDRRLRALEAALKHLRGK